MNGWPDSSYLWVGAATSSDRRLPGLCSVRTRRRKPSYFLFDSDAIGNIAMQNASDLTNLAHHIGKLLRIDRLRAVGKSFVRLMVDFNHQTIRAHRNRRPGQRNHLVALTCTVAWIDNDGQVTQPLHRRNNTQV